MSVGVIFLGTLNINMVEVPNSHLAFSSEVTTNEHELGA
jgi:hypothetical protein